MVAELKGLQFRTWAGGFSACMAIRIQVRGVPATIDGGNREPPRESKLLHSCSMSFMNRTTLMRPGFENGLAAVSCFQTSTDEVTIALLSVLRSRNIGGAQT